MIARPVLSRVHAVAGVLAFILIAVFLAASAFAEARGDLAGIAAVKHAIVLGLLLLVPCLIAAGASGFVISKGRTAGLPGRKLKRMRFIAANGLLVLVPAALYLSWKAGSGQIDARFALVQAAEFIAGGTNLVLMGLNIRDGMKMRGRFRPRKARRFV